jgi:hypothetical protein
LGFWILLYASVKLLDQHAWIGPVSALLMWLFVLATVINYGIEILRSRSASGRRTLSHGGYPRWFLRFAHGDQGSAPSSDKLYTQNGKSG